MTDSLYFPIVFFIGALVCIYIGFSGKTEADTLENFGVLVQSLPLKEYTEETEGGRVTGYEITPTFLSQAGTSHKCTASIEATMIPKLSETPIVTVNYLPNKPSVCEVVGQKKSNHMLLLIIGILTFFGSLFGLYKHYRMR